MVVEGIICEICDKRPMEFIREEQGTIVEACRYCHETGGNTWQADEQRAFDISAGAASSSSDQATPLTPWISEACEAGLFSISDERSSQSVTDDEEESESESQSQSTDSENWGQTGHFPFGWWTCENCHMTLASPNCTQVSFSENDGGVNYVDGFRLCVDCYERHESIKSNCT